MDKKLIAISAGAGMLALFAPLALAQSIVGTTVTIDPGPYIQAVSDALIPLAAGVALFLIRKLPGPMADFLIQRHADALLAKALTYGANRVKGAGFARPVTIDVVNPWVAMAIEYLDDRAPDFLRRYGAEAVKKMVLARIPLAQDAAVRPAVQAAFADPKLAGYNAPHRA